MGSFRNTQRLTTRAARPTAEPVIVKKKASARGKAEAEERRLEKERAAAVAWRAEMDRKRRNQHTAERKKRRRQERREVREQLEAIKKKNAAILARLSPNDQGYRPQPVDSVLVGKTRVTGLTAVAVKRKKTLTKAQWEAQQGTRLR